MITIDKEARVPVIVESKAAHTETLFKPVNGRTADGYVIRRAKDHVDVWLCGKEYRINRWLVWCKGSKQEDGRILWQHGVLDIPFTLAAADSAARALSAGSYWVNREVAYQFKA
jgi:hypothetical protein